MRAMLSLLTVLFLAPPAAAEDLAFDLPSEAATDGACVGTDALRCLAMVYYCSYVLATQADVERCIYVLE